MGCLQEITPAGWVHALSDKGVEYFKWLFLFEEITISSVFMRTPLLSQSQCYSSLISPFQTVFSQMPKKFKSWTNVYYIFLLIFKPPTIFSLKDFVRQLW